MNSAIAESPSFETSTNNNNISNDITSFNNNSNNNSTDIISFDNQNGGTRTPLADDRWNSQALSGFVSRLPTSSQSDPSGSPSKTPAIATTTTTTDYRFGVLASDPFPKRRYCKASRRTTIVALDASSLPSASKPRAIIHSMGYFALRKRPMNGNTNPTKTVLQRYHHLHRSKKSTAHRVKRKYKKLKRMGRDTITKIGGAFGATVRIPLLLCKLKKNKEHCTEDLANSKEEYELQESPDRSHLQNTNLRARPPASTPYRSPSRRLLPPNMDAVSNVLGVTLQMLPKEPASHQYFALQVIQDSSKDADHDDLVLMVDREGLIGHIQRRMGPTTTVQQAVDIAIRSVQNTDWTKLFRMVEAEAASDVVQGSNFPSDQHQDNAVQEPKERAPEHTHQGQDMAGAVDDSGEDNAVEEHKEESPEHTLQGQDVAVAADDSGEPRPSPSSCTHVFTPQDQRDRIQRAAETVTKDFLQQYLDSQDHLLSDVSLLETTLTALGYTVFCTLFYYSIESSTPQHNGGPVHARSIMDYLLSIKTSDEVDHATSAKSFHQKNSQEPQQNASNTQTTPCTDTPRPTGGSQTQIYQNTLALSGRSLSVEKATRSDGGVSVLLEDNELIDNGASFNPKRWFSEDDTLDLDFEGELGEVKKRQRPTYCKATESLRAGYNTTGRFPTQRTGCLSLGKKLAFQDIITQYEKSSVSSPCPFPCAAFPSSTAAMAIGGTDAPARKMFQSQKKMTHKRRQGENLQARKKQRVNINDQQPQEAPTPEVARRPEIMPRSPAEQPKKKRKQDFVDCSTCGSTKPREFFSIAQTEESEPQCRTCPLEGNSTGKGFVTVWPPPAEQPKTNRNSVNCSTCGSTKPREYFSIAQAEKSEPQCRACLLEGNSTSEALVTERTMTTLQDDNDGSHSQQMNSSGADNSISQMLTESGKKTPKTPFAAQKLDVELPRMPKKRRQATKATATSYVASTNRLSFKKPTKTNEQHEPEDETNSSTSADPHDERALVVYSARVRDASLVAFPPATLQKHIIATHLRTRFRSVVPDRKLSYWNVHKLRLLQTAIVNEGAIVSAMDRVKICLNYSEHLVGKGSEAQKRAIIFKLAEWGILHLDKYSDGNLIVSLVCFTCIIMHYASGNASSGFDSPVFLRYQNSLSGISWS